ncbi:MAG: hypothetical protein JNK87_19215 [Bryobacterales bacterium]|nr:hypothetical protein [Bryobacterales bacterium]
MPPTPAQFQQLAHDWVNAYEGDASALDRLNTHYERSFTVADLKAEIWRRIYAFRQRSSKVEKNYLQLAEAQLLLAQDAGFGNWEDVLAAAAKGESAPGPHYALSGSTIAPRRRLTRGEWDDLIAIAREHRVTTIEAEGLMTDDVLRKIATLDHITRLRIAGSREMSEAGLLLLAGMPQLEHLQLGGYPGTRINDASLEVFRHLPNLREFEMTWQAGVSDAGVANLRFCDKLESVDLMGSPTGNGALEALQGKRHLRRIHMGRMVTDAGFRFLPNFPLLTAPSPGASLLLDGPFTGEGLASLAGLAGIHELDLFWHVSELTPAAFAHLAHIPNLQQLGADGKLASDEAMPHIAAVPRLRKLRIQESIATEDGFVALAKSRSLESVWGRVCPNFGDRAFLAFAAIPTLQGMGIGLAKVSDAALAALPHFPALRELTPIGLTDPGFVHVGQCRDLQRLTCMYCRDTTDTATEHIANLGIRYYYAGLTKITDRSLRILGGMHSLEQIDLYECLGITDAGLPYIAALPNLKEVHLDGLPHVTLEGTTVFRPPVRVLHSL